MAAETSTTAEDGFPRAYRSEIAALGAIVAEAAAMADRIESEAAHALLLRALGLLRERAPEAGDGATASHRAGCRDEFRPS